VAAAIPWIWLSGSKCRSLYAYVAAARGAGSSSSGTNLSRLSMMVSRISQAGRQKRR
jgi:hypothetical protein